MLASLGGGKVGMSVRGSLLWGSMFAIATACGSNAGRGGADRGGGGGQSGAGADLAGTTALDGGEPPNDAGGPHVSGAAGSSAQMAGAAGTTAPGEAATLIVEVTYGGACGTDADRCATHTFDEDGTLIRAFEDGDCDGAPDTQCSLFVTWEGGSRAEHDTDCNGKPDACSIQLIVDNGDRPSTELGENCKGETQCTTYLKDEMGVDLGYEIDEDCDGTIEHCFEFREEPAGTRRGAYDMGCDGTADSGCMTTTVDASTGYTREERDSDCNGQPDSVRCFVNAANGVSTNAGEDRDCDGALDASCYTWTYDDQSRPISYGHDADCDGGFDAACATFSYDAFGNSQQETDVNCDRVTCTRWAHYRSATGGPMLDAGCDGVVESNCEMWSLDDEGRPLRFDYDHDCDGAPSLAPDVTVACWTTWKYTRI
jgi:hypothetical protein